jgi:hypothetical protein
MFSEPITASGNSHKHANSTKEKIKKNIKKILTKKNGGRAAVPGRPYEKAGPEARRI